MSQCIILTGTSSSGKTSIAKAIQETCLDTPYLHFQMDAFWDMVPKDITANSKNFPKMKDVLIQSAIAHLEAGHLLVMDIVFSPTSALSLKTSLARFKPSIVQVTASLDVLEKREIERGNRNIGMAAQQFNDFGDDHIGDLVINTDTNTATESANLIIKHLCLRSNQTNGSKPRTPSTNP